MAIILEDKERWLTALWLMKLVEMHCLFRSIVLIQLSLLPEYKRWWLNRRVLIIEGWLIDWLILREERREWEEVLIKRRWPVYVARAMRFWLEVKVENTGNDYWFVLILILVLFVLYGLNILIEDDSR